MHQAVARPVHRGSLPRRGEEEFEALRQLIRGLKCLKKKQFDVSFVCNYQQLLFKMCFKWHDANKINLISDWISATLQGVPTWS